MKKFTIEEYLINTDENGTTRIKMTIRPNSYHLFIEDVKGLKEAIENIDSRPDDRYSQSMSDRMIGKYFCKEEGRFSIKKVILHNPATIVFWYDGTKTVVKCQDGDVYSPEVGIAMCYMKKALGNQSNFNNTFKRHVPAALVAQTLSKEHLDAVKKTLEEDKPITRTYLYLDTEAIYRILRVNKWTVKEFAQVVGVDHSSVYHWLKGGGVKKRNISKMVKALHVPEEAIIKEEK